MSEMTAIDTLNEFFIKYDNNELREAWAQVQGILSPFPPTALGECTNEARLLANQFAKTGLYGEWMTPPAHSRAMERLVHRMTCLLEAFLRLLDDAQATATNNEACND